MAFTEQTVDSDELYKQRLGYIAISLTDYTDGAEPEVTAGSCFEDAGSLYQCAGDEDMDVAGAFAGFAANSLFYCYINVTTGILYLSATSPAWDDAKQGYYLAASPTHRCIFRGWKDSGGNWDQKTIITGYDSIEHTLSGYNNRNILQVQYQGADAVLVEDAWTKLTFDTEVFLTIPGASTAAGVITLPSGYYCIENMGMLSKIVNSSGGNIAYTQLRLRNTTDGSTTAGVYNSHYVSLNQTYYFNTGFFQKTYFTINASKNYEMQYYVADLAAGIAFSVVGTINSYYPTGLSIKKLNEEIV